MKYLFIWPLANIRHHLWISIVSVLGVAAAGFVIATLLGFLSGYQEAVRRDVDRMGYDLLITAKGCPYEAATLMLRGGVGMRYMPDSVVPRLQSDPMVQATYPTLIHPVRDPMNPEGMAIYKGVSPGLRSALGLQLFEGQWFEKDGAEEASDGVVLGYEAAELEQRHPGDAYLIPASGSRPAKQSRVRGVLARTGTQIDGSILLPLRQAQSLFQLPGKLTGVGVQVAPEHAEDLPDLRERYQKEPDLQVVSLSQVEQALRRAMVAMVDVAQVMAGVLALMAAALLVNTTLLRTLAEHRRLFVLHAIGFRRRFIYGVALVENITLVVTGACLGLGAAAILGDGSTAFLVSYLPYAPQGNLVALSGDVIGGVLVGALLIGILATLPPLARIRRYGDLGALREG